MKNITIYSEGASVEANTSAKYKKHHQYKKFLLFFILGLLIFTAFFYGIMIKYTFDQTVRTDNWRLGQEIINSVEALVRPVPVDAMSGKVYFANQKLMLPQVPNTLGQLNYYYSWGLRSSETDELNISSARDVLQPKAKMTFSNGDLTSIMETVPKLQACTRGILVTYKKIDGPTYGGQKTLANGKTVYFYSEDKCRNPELLEYVKQINSY